MRTRLLMSPPWVQGAVAGVGGGAIYGGVFIVMGLLIGSRQTSSAELVVLGVFGGLVAAVVGGVMSTRRARALVERPEVAVLRPADRAAAILASRTGPVPDDPRVRSAATKLAVDNAARAYRQRWWLPAVVVVGGVPAVLIQVTHPSIVSAVYIAALVMMGVSGLTSRRRFDHRREVLTGSPGL